MLFYLSWQLPPQPYKYSLATNMHFPPPTPTSTQRHTKYVPMTSPNPLGGNNEGKRTEV